MSRRVLLRLLLLLAFIAGATATLRADDKPATLLTENQRLQFQSRLRKTSPEERAAAIRELGHFRDVEAVKLIVHHGLRDRELPVSAAAMLAVRAHAADAAIGRSLLEQLRAEVTGRRRYAFDFAKRLAEAITDYRFPDLYADLLKFSTDCDSPLAQAIGEAVMSAIDRLAADATANDVQLLERMAATPQFGQSFGFRRCVIDAALRIRNREAITFLVAQLRPIEGELRHAIIGGLRTASRQDIADDTAAWERWWRGAKTDFAFPEPAASESMASLDRGTPRYYDVPIRAKRLVFILDTSKSMAASDMITRLEAAKRELTKTIDELPGGVLFNIVVFNSTVSVWQDKLAPASESWKTHAKAFVHAQRPIGKTATYDALQAAYKLDSNVETFFLLSDGAPSDGEIVKPDTLLEAIRKQNRQRRVTINTIGVFGGGDSEGLEPFMRTLASDNFGVFKRAN